MMDEKTNTKVTSKMEKQLGESEIHMHLDSVFGPCIEARRRLIKITNKYLGKIITDQLIHSMEVDCVSLLEDYVLRDLSQGETDTNVTINASSSDVEIVWPEWFKQYLLYGLRTSRRFKNL